ncbi:MAG: CbrC family protein [Chitinophagaceae bacterium]
MKFKHFESPEKFGTYLIGAAACDICGFERKCFDGSFFSGEEEINAICPDCLIAGELKEMDIFTCQGDRGELEQQLREINPAMSDEEIEKRINEKTEELEKTTPALITWQDWDWPACDGDYCVFIAYGSQPLFNQLAKDKNGKRLFKDSIYYTMDADDDIDELWDESLPEKNVKNSKDAETLSPLFYVFKSLNSDTIVTLWDID